MLECVYYVWVKYWCTSSIMIKWEINNNLRLLFTDADSFIYDIKIEDGYEDFSKDKSCFDFSNYSAKSKYNYDLNESVVVKINDEMSSFAVEEFIWLKPKRKCCE